MSDALARRRIREDFDATLWVEAAAGTGKTTELVRRIVGLVVAGKGRLSSLVAVTFTEKAAGELRLRLRAELDAAREGVSAEVRGRLDAAIEELETARVGTIHALCADLLRERPVEAGIDPLFEVLGDDEAPRLFDVAFGDWLEQRLEDPPEGVRRMLRRPADRDGVGPRLQLRKAGLQLADRRDFDGAWTRPPFDRLAAIDAVVERLREFGRYAGREASGADNLARAARTASAWLAELDRRELTEPRDHDGLEVELARLRRDWDWAKKGTGASYGPGVARTEVLAARGRAGDVLSALVEASDADLAACLFEDLRSLVDAYEREKHRRSRLDYVDLLLLTRRMLVDDRRLRNELQARFTHVFVDEFQDTDPLQADVVLLLAADDPGCDDPARARPAAGKLFVVGDPKQAIYRFRRADIGCYTALRDRLIGEGAVLLHLSTSFRADPRIQQAVNAAFAPRMQGSGQATYVALEPHRAAVVGRPAVVALPVPRPYGARGQVTQEAIRRSAPEAVGNFVEWLIGGSGWTVGEGDHEVAIGARHVCLLFRSTQSVREDLVGPFARALEARGIAHAVVGGRGFHERDEVRALRSALQALEWPDDALSLYATLKGPLFALPDDALFLWKSRVGTLEPHHRPELAPDDAGFADLLQVRDALALLAEVRKGRHRRPIAATLGLLLAGTRAHAGFAAAASGEQVLANVLRVGQLARRFESTGSTSFRAFVDALEDEAERHESPEAPVVEEGTDGVRLMTVHKSKGLEFPVTILADLTTVHTHRKPSRFIDPARRLWAMPLCGCVPADLREHGEDVLEDDRLESDRLAYVAATRARDLLVVPVLGDDPHRGGWFEALLPVLYPAAESRGSPRVAPGCPSFGGATVLEGGPSIQAPVVPGLHVPAVGAHEVVWWEALGSTVPWRGGLRRDTLLAADGDAAGGIERYEVWRLAREARVRAGSVPSIDAVVATEARGLAAEVPIERTAVVREGRPYGPRFGSLVHAALAAVGYDADEEQIAATVALHGRILGAPPDERAAARIAVAAALAHPLVARAAVSADCRREVAVAWRDGERLIEGVADLVFVEADGWTVVDFKTEDDPRSNRRVYEAQLGAYVAAVAAATGQRARGVILSV